VTGLFRGKGKEERNVKNSGLETRSKKSQAFFWVCGLMFLKLLRLGRETNVIYVEETASKENPRGNGGKQTGKEKRNKKGL